MTQCATRLWGVVAVVALVPLAGCGHGQSYCDAVRDHESELGSIARAPEGSDRAGLLQALPIFEDLQAKAPDDVTDDWQVLVTRLQALRTALDRAGVDPATYDPKHPRAGLSAEDRVRIRRAAAELAASDTQQALDTVQQEVLDVCHTPLDL
jgi:hypothetical protein